MRPTFRLSACLFALGVVPTLLTTVYAGPPSAVADIAHWATIKEAAGPEGRPLPLTGSWVCQDMFGPRRMMEMIEAGHHVMPTLGAGPGFLASYAYILENQGFLKEKLPAYFSEIEPRAVPRPAHGGLAEQQRGGRDQPQTRQHVRAVRTGVRNGPVG